jgi:hypothetical protein
MDQQMNMICIAEGTYKITKGKTYQVNAHSTHLYWIRDDEGHMQFMSKDFFRTKQEIRDEKLNELGII